MDKIGLDMKNLRYFLLFIICTVLVSADLDAMKRQRDEDTIALACMNLDETVEVPKSVVKYSTQLSAYCKKSPQSTSYFMMIDVVDQKVLQATIDCLKIIGSENDVENGLMNCIDDFVEKQSSANKKEVIKSFVEVGRELEIEHLLSAFKQYPAYKNKKILDQRNQRLNEILDQYNQQLDTVTQQAKIAFEKIENKKNSAIIIDIDDTALSRATSPGVVVVNNVKTVFPYFPALNQVRVLYKDLVSMGFKIFFLTARMDKTSQNLSFFDCYEATVCNLQKEDYSTFEQVICAPLATRNKICHKANGDANVEVDLLAEWKESERNKIAEKFTIAGTIDDTEENLRGKNVGYPVLIPRL